MNGRLIKKLQISNNIVTIDLTGNAKGVYFVNVVTKEEVIIKKIVFE